MWTDDDFIISLSVLLRLPEPYDTVIIQLEYIWNFESLLYCADFHILLILWKTLAAD